jgi:signal transduction histidine kinase
MKCAKRILPIFLVFIGKLFAQNSTDSLFSEANRVYQSGDYVESLRLFIASRDAALAESDTLNFLLARIRIADINRVSRNFNAAFQELDEVNALANSAAMLPVRAQALFLKSSVYFELGEFRKAIDFGKEALIVLPPEENPSATTILTVLGAAYTRLENDSALSYFNQAIERCITTGDSSEISLAYSNLALYTMNMRNNYNEALRYAQMAYDIAVLKNIPMYQLLSVRVLGTTHAALGDFSSAYHMEQKEGELIERMFSTTRLLQFELLNDRILNERKQAEEKLHHQQLQIARSRVKMLLVALGSGATILILLVFALIFIRRANQRNKRNLEMVSTLNAKLEEAKQGLERNNRTKDLILSALGHDLRTPLGQTVALAELMRLKMSSPEEVTELTDLLQQAGEGGLAMLDNLLLWTRHQLDHLEPRPVLVQMSLLLNETIAQLSSVLKRKGIIVKTEYDEIPPFQTDPVLLQVVLRNLIGNAAKFSTPGSVVQVHLFATEKEVCITVRDFGSGMDKSVIELVATGSVQSPAQGTSGERGAGIGLMLCMELIHMLGANLSFEQPEGGGTRAKVVVPFKR